MPCAGVVAAGPVMLAIDLAESGDIVISDSQIALGWMRRGRSKARADLNDRLLAARDRAGRQEAEGTLRAAAREPGRPLQRAATGKGTK